MIRRSFTALLLLPLSALAQTQVPNVFEDGTPASAAEVNENFQYVLENASGGCSATQQDNSVVIECADGTSGVIAGAGTVVVVPEGVIGESPIVDYENGPIVVKDANGVVLGEVIETLYGNPVISYFVGDSASQMAFFNSDEGVVEFAPAYSSNVNFLTEDCSGLMFYQTYVRLVRLGDHFYIKNPDSNPETLLFKSKKRGAQVIREYDQAGDCISEEFVASAFLLTEAFPAPEILNAAYPVRLEQLP